VVTGDDVEGWDVVDAVGGLVAKSMVVAEPGAGEHTRYQLLETLRQYGRERLDEDRETDRWRRRHALYFAAFAAEVGRGLRGRDEFAWRERLMADLDNLRSAVAWGLDTGVEEDEQTAVAIVAWLADQGSTRGPGIGGWAEQAIPALERSTPGHRSAVLGAAAAAAQFRGDFDVAERYARAALEEGYPTDNPSPYQAPLFLAIALMYQGRRDDAARCLDSAEEAIVGRDDEDYLLAWLHSGRAILNNLFVDDEDEEIAQARLAMSLAERNGNPSNLANASYALGKALCHRHPDEAIVAFDQAVGLARRGVNGVVPPALSLGARVAAAQGDADGAKTRLRDALEESMRDETWGNIVLSLDAAVDIFCYLGEARAAVVLAGAVETTLASRRSPSTASHGTGLVVRTANLERVRETLGDTCYQEARAEGVAMSRQDALAFALQHL
jgi:tetratricopeptide (TPR) repeat protein